MELEERYKNKEFFKLELKNMDNIILNVQLLHSLEWMLKVNMILIPDYGEDKMIIMFRDDHLRIEGNKIILDLEEREVAER